MKNIIIKLGASIIVLLFGVIIFSSCSKSENNDTLDKNSHDNVTIKDNLSDKEYKSRLIDLNINFWTNLSSNPIIEVKKVCDEKDIEGLISLCKFSDEELSNFMNKSIYYAKSINPDNNNSSCNCDSDINFDNIYKFVNEIQKQGGPKVFFQRFSQNEYQNPNGLKEPPDWDKVANSLAVCTLTCLPLTWNPPAWAACIAACSAACYYLPH